MRILADAALPNAKEVFSQYGEVILKAGRQIEDRDLEDIDALIIRSVTKVNKELLTYASKLKFIGTATAGTDHVDCELLDEMGIAFDNAPGSNCESVGDYILSTLLVLAQRYSFDFAGKSIGIIGCGHTGSQVFNKAKALGLNIVKNDPPRFRNGDLSCQGTLDEALACDIVTFHVPLQKEGIDKTYHLLNKERIEALKPGTLVINASRGPVMDNEAMYEFLKSGRDLKVWCDVFEGEPEIKVRELIPYLQGATAHIAGYSYESKRRASVMLASSMSKLLNLEDPKPYKMPTPELQALDIGKIETLDLNLINRLVFSVYDVRADAYLFKNSCVDGKSFDKLRVNYRERREMSSLTLHNVPKAFKERLALLGFTLA